MKKLILLLIVASGFTSLIAQDDVEGSKDPALFSRMPNHYIYSYTDNEFDRYEFPLNRDKKEPVEGHFITMMYLLKDNSPSVSGLQIIRNFQNAIKKIGGQVLYEYEDGGLWYTTLKVSKNGKETWAEVNQDVGGYSVTIIEKQSMEQDIVADAASMAGSLKETGKVVLYGIYFDSGKSILKPESQPSVEQISKLMKEDPGLKLYVVGHTDNTGDYITNQKLSMERAMAVRTELISHFSIAAERLYVFGAGPFSPVASNEKEEGRALNRRVELVKQ